MAHSVPACSFCHKNLTLQGNKPNSEFPETTVISILCGHLFHSTCIKKLFGNKKVALCMNKNCVKNIERKYLKDVNFETISSPEAPSVTDLEATIDGFKLSTKANRTTIAKLTTDVRKLKEQNMIKLSQFENVKKQNVVLQTKTEEYIGIIEKLKLRNLKLENVEKQNLQLVNQNKSFQTMSEEYIETTKKLKLRKSELESVEKQKLQLIDQNKQLQIKNEEYIETTKKLKLRKSELESVEKQKLQLIDQNKQLQIKNEEYIETTKKLKLRKSELESVEKQKLQLIDQKLQIKNEEYIETTKKLKLRKSELESVEVEKQKFQLSDQNKQLQSQNEEYIEITRKLKLQLSELESVEKQKLQLIGRNKQLQTKNEEYFETITRLELQKSELGKVGKRNFQLVNQNKELQTKNEDYIKIIKELYKAINETSTNLENVNLKQENIVDFRNLESKINIGKNLQESIAGVKINYDYENGINNSADKMMIDKEPELRMVPHIVLRKVESKRGDTAMFNPSDQAKNEAKIVKQSISGKSSVLHDNEKQCKSEATNEKLESPLFRRDLENKPSTFRPLPLFIDELVPRLQIKTVEIQTCTPAFTPSPQCTSRNHEVRMMVEREPREAEESQIHKNDLWHSYTYQNREMKKRNSNEVQRQEYDYSFEKGAKRHKENSLSPQQECLRPFFLTGHRFGQFSQVLYKGEYAYASGEYLLLGDGVINAVLSTALQTDKHFAELLKKSPYYFPCKSIREFDCHLAELPFLPKKVMISIGDIDSVTNDRSYFEVKKALQSLFNTVYDKGVKKIVMIPPIKHNEWPERRCDLDFFLEIKAGTAFDWEYYYMQELSRVMSKFSASIQRGGTYQIASEDTLKLAEKITNYTTEKGEPSI